MNLGTSCRHSECDSLKLDMAGGTHRYRWALEG